MDWLSVGRRRYCWGSSFELWLFFLLLLEMDWLIGTPVKRWNMFYFLLVVPPLHPPFLSLISFPFLDLKQMPFLLLMISLLLISLLNFIHHLKHFLLSFFLPLGKKLANLHFHLTFELDPLWHWTLTYFICFISAVPIRNRSARRNQSSASAACSSINISFACCCFCFTQSASPQRRIRNISDRFSLTLVFIFIFIIVHNNRLGFLNNVLFLIINSRQDSQRPLNNFINFRPPSFLQPRKDNKAINCNLKRIISGKMHQTVMFPIMVKTTTFFFCDNRLIGFRWFFDNNFHISKWRQFLNDLLSKF